MRSSVIRLSVLCILLATSAQAGQCKIGKVTTVPMTMDGGKQFIEISINETPGKFEIASGYSTTVLEPDYAAQAHVGVDRHSGTVELGDNEHGSLPANQAHARHIQVGDISFQDWLFVVRPKRGDNPASISGVLGRDFLHYFDIEMDFKAAMLTIWRPVDCTELHPFWKNDFDTIPLKKEKDYGLTVPVWLDKVFLDLALETSGGDEVGLTRKAANSAGATDDQLSRDPQLSSNKSTHEIPDVRHTFKTLLVGNGEFDSPEIVVEMKNTTTLDVFNGGDGYVGLNRFLADRVWISYNTNTLFIQTAKQAAGK